MIQAPVNETRRAIEADSVAAVVTICAQRKKLQAVVTPQAIVGGTQASVSRQWRVALADASAETTVGKLYAGRSFLLATKAAQWSSSPLFVVSAGLGLVAADTPAPAYGLTVASGQSESVAAKVTDGFDVTAWFADLLAGPFSTSWAQVAGEGPGRVLVALTRPYAEMVGGSLAGLASEAVGRLRIFGASLRSTLPLALRPAVMPYDDRLDAILPGTRFDFAQRALLHFVQHIANRQEHRETDAAAVIDALGRVEPPARTIRPRRTDDEILTLIGKRLVPTASASRLLRRLRDEDGIACEQGRFARLFGTAASRAVE